MHLRRKLLWIGAVYLASGLGSGVARQVWPIYFRDRGLSLAEVGLASLLFLPWSLKILWAPLVDRVGSRQQWAVSSLGVMALATVGVALLPVSAQGASLTLWAVLLCFTLAAATVDLSVDAYAVDLATERHSGPINSARVAAYRTGMILFGGGLVLLADEERWGLGPGSGWHAAWIALTAALLVLAAVVWASPRVPLDPGERRHPFGWVRGWLLTRRMGVALAFVGLFKAGDSALFVMAQTYWLDRGFNLSEIGLVATTLGTALSIVGAVAGGFLVARRGLFPALVVGGIAQALSNAGYLVVAIWNLGRGGLYPAALLESFCQGLGTAAFLSFLMILCQKEHAATQFALLTALYGLSRDLVGAVSGFGVERLGYVGFFAATCLLAVPGLALLPSIRSHIRDASTVTDL